MSPIHCISPTTENRSHSRGYIGQKEGEPLRDYIERFNDEVVQVLTDDRMKLYLLDRGLRPGRDFVKPRMLSLRKQRSTYNTKKSIRLWTYENPSAKKMADRHIKLMKKERGENL
ncbi:hypothetical protein A2U01_0003003 [Trifolium medium]|uniref:Retrotransposon gag domain-containing protein n=1 Tax=Trifolium medium TaxID=97028 RepID=A0A392M551_9FABA|nr:hypothetical protein [Trifolium medium]